METLFQSLEKSFFNLYLMKKIIYLSFVFIVSCSIKNPNNYTFIKKDIFPNFWQLGDQHIDSLMGVSASKIKSNEYENKGSEVIVALIDGNVDLNHEMLKKHFWKNTKEIDDNGKDDDNNGYIDDLNGWNFWGNKNSIESTNKASYDFVRVIKISKDIDGNNINNFYNGSNFNDYFQKAKSKYEFEYQKQIVDVESYLYSLEKSFNHQKDTILQIYPNLTFNINELKEIKSENKRVMKIISNLIYYLNMDIEQFLNDSKRRLDFDKKYYLNIEYNDRLLVGDNPYDIKDTIYGNRYTGYETFANDHGTAVCSQIILLFEYLKNKNLKIMPIVTAVYGDEYDKDIALAIRYAVNQGAKIINLTMSKEFSTNNEWVRSAIIYAHDNDVLIVKSAGNYSYNVSNNDYFPNDKNTDQTEFVNNFINVGASTKYFDKRIYADFSCYSKTDVDIFAPGDSVYVAKPKDLYMVDSGTSYSAPLVSGVAALIKSYYPKLTAPEIKEILMVSGTSVEVDVEITDENGNPKTVPFSSLSKSGKIVNAYNAMLMAKNYKKWKKGKWKLPDEK